MIIDVLRCIKCNKANCVDLRYMWNHKLDTYELEYHCTTLEGGCDFYRLLPLGINESHDHGQEFIRTAFA